MNNLYIDSKRENEPKVEFDAATGDCNITGVCYPEDGYYFFENLNSWIDEYVEQVKGAISFTINLKYFNTSSSKGIYLILINLKKYQHTGGNVRVIWYYDEEDEYMLEEIKGYAQEANILISTVPY